MKRYRPLLTAGLALCAIAMAKADNVSMASGQVRFTTPVAWINIMQVDGDPEVRVFQVPNPSPGVSNSLARVSVTAKQVANAQEFSDYVNRAIAKAKQLKDYRASSQPSGAQNYFVYTASEDGTPYTYTERYWLRHDRVIELRCARPGASQAGQTWAANFDKGCQDIASYLHD